MLTASAHRALAAASAHTVASVADLGADRVRNQVAAHRWQRVGRAVIRHNGEPSVHELRRAALIVLGPRAVLTAFTALEEWGLRDWSRDAIHVLVPRGARVVRPPQLALRVHYTDSPTTGEVSTLRRLHRPAAAAVRAAATFAEPRPACAILAATVQQRLARPEELAAILTASTRVRNRALLLAAARDIGLGAQALSEIDFARLCRRHALPEPVRQAVRREPSGRCRYLDAEWIRSDGRRVVAEVDGALHLLATQWWADQVRQNELVIGGDLVLRFPSVVVRAEPAAVAAQLRRALRL